MSRVTPIVLLLADTADGADGIFLSCTHPDDPVSGSGFALDVKTPAGTPVSDVGGQRVRGGFWANPHCFLEMSSPQLPVQARKRSAAPLSRSCARP
jgi:hypothetical protein